MIRAACPTTRCRWRWPISCPSTISRQAPRRCPAMRRRWARSPSPPKSRQGSSSSPSSKQSGHDHPDHRGVPCLPRNPYIAWRLVTDFQQLVVKTVQDKNLAVDFHEQDQMRRFGNTHPCQRKPVPYYSGLQQQIELGDRVIVADTALGTYFPLGKQRRLPAPSGVRPDRLIDLHIHCLNQKPRGVIDIRCFHQQPRIGGLAVVRLAHTKGQGSRRLATDRRREADQRHAARRKGHRCFRVTNRASKQQKNKDKKADHVPTSDWHYLMEAPTSRK